MNKKNIFIGLVIFFSSIASSFAYDEVLDYDFSGLGNLSIGYIMPYNLTDFIVSQKSEVSIVYTAYDCEQQNDFSVYVNGTLLDVPCTAGYNNAYHIEYGSLILEPGTYQLFVNENRDNQFRIAELNIYMTYDNGGNIGGSSGGYDTDYKKVGFFEDYDEFIEFAEETTIAYMIALIVVMLFFLGQGLFYSLD